MSVFTQFDHDFGDGYYSSIPTDDGGHNVVQNGTVIDHHGPEQMLNFEDGHAVIKVFDNNTGIHRTIVDGQTVEIRVPNTLGGENIYHGHELAKITTENSFGGENIYDGSMNQVGVTVPNIYGGDDYLSFEGNSHDILNYNDPLAHSHEYLCNPFDITGKHIHVPGCGHMSANPDLVHVDGYTRADGTYVEEHWRTAPDGDPTNNFSSFK